MIKKLLTVATVIFSVAVNAQSHRAMKKNTFVVENTTTTELRSAAALSCGTISVINPTTNISLYTVSPSTVTGCSPNAGYVFGTNCYGLTEEATFFDAGNYSSVTAPSITAVSVGFYRNATTGRGTHGTTGIVGLKIYPGTSNTIAPVASVASATATLAQIIAAQTGTSSLVVYTFTFVPTSIPSTGFFASVVLPTAAADTAVIYTQTASVGSYTVPAAWEYDGSVWSDVAGDWGINVNHVMLPIVCGNSIATGISQNLGLSNGIKIMPNPSTGLFNVVVTLQQTENLSVTVTNALGQQVLSNKYDGISNELLSMDLTNQANGVYFVTVSNGKDKMVQRLILSK